MTEQENKRMDNLLLVIQEGAPGAKNQAASELIPLALKCRWPYGIAQILRAADVDAAARQKAMDDYLSQGRLHLGAEASSNLHPEVLLSPEAFMKERVARWLGGQPEQFGLALSPHTIDAYRNHVKKTLLGYQPIKGEVLTNQYVEAAAWLLDNKSPLKAVFWLGDNYGQTVDNISQNAKGYPVPTEKDLRRIKGGETLVLSGADGQEFIFREHSHQCQIFENKNRLSKDIELWATALVVRSTAEYFFISEHKWAVAGNLLAMAKNPQLLEEGRIIAADAALPLFASVKTVLVTMPNDSGYPEKTRDEVKNTLAEWQAECLNTMPEKINYNYTGHYAWQGFSPVSYRELLRFIAGHAQTEAIFRKANSKLDSAFNYAATDFAAQGEYSNVIELASCKEQGCTNAHREFAKGKIDEAVRNAIKTAVAGSDFGKLREIEKDPRLQDRPHLQIEATLARASALAAIELSLVDKRPTVVALGAGQPKQAPANKQAQQGKIPGTG